MNTARLDRNFYISLGCFIWGFVHEIQVIRGAPHDHHDSSSRVNLKAQQKVIGGVRSLSNLDFSKWTPFPK